MGTADSQTGYPCEECGAFPSFSLAPGRHLCYKHLPWNDGMTDEEILARTAITAVAGKPSPTPSSEPNGK